MLFFMGTNEKPINMSLRKESDVHNDLIFADFVESYFNLSIKIMEALKNQIIRDISYEEYPLNYYPPYCSGTCYVLSKDAVTAIVNVCQNKKLIHLEDVAITG
ncbi:beta-1,3-galactosyltransferase 1-like [Octopus sinensis]|uniref:Hexosyltransferase n=1 Tax=Octopus sinensis TaxID=2607531 RepID=A0A6P7TS28_9MOLL|nr:beta-1,3-galactosyltransferase 1-like [Octopus sinensis]